MIVNIDLFFISCFQATFTRTTYSPKKSIHHFLKLATAPWVSIFILSGSYAQVFLRYVKHDSPLDSFSAGSFSDTLKPQPSLISLLLALWCYFISHPKYQFCLSPVSPFVSMEFKIYANLFYLSNNNYCNAYMN